MNKVDVAHNGDPQRPDEFVTASKSSLTALTLGAIGVVYGDIGTSVLYAFKEVFVSGHVLITTDNILGILSLFFWTLTIIVTLKYVLLIMRADNLGEGGLMALLALASQSVKDKPQLRRVLLMLGVLMLTLLRVPRKVVTAMLVVLVIVALAKFIAAALLLKSWALLLWINSEALLGMLLGILLLFVAMRLPRSAAMGFGTATALCYFAIVNFVFDDNTPSAAMSIYHWHYGHLLNYNGLAQTITLVFPLLLIFHLWRIRKV